MEIHWPETAGIPNRTAIRAYLQGLAHRIVQGHFRYGVPKKSKKYRTRIDFELEAYDKTGNYEHLLNVSVYCWLESMAPQNKKFHFDNTVNSVTRGRDEFRT